MSKHTEHTEFTSLKREAEALRLAVAQLADCLFMTTQCKPVLRNAVPLAAKSLDAIRSVSAIAGRCADMLSMQDDVACPDELWDERMAQRLFNREMAMATVGGEA